MKKFYAHFFTLFIVAFNTYNSYSQNNVKLSGFVHTSETNFALKQVSITLLPNGLEVFTDYKGYYEFKNLSKGTYSLQVRDGIHKPKLINELIIEDNLNVVVDFTLRDINLSSDLDINDTSAAFVENYYAQNNFRRNSVSEVEEIHSRNKFSFNDISAAESARRLNQVLLQNSQSALVRGMNERYTSYNLHGFTFPSIDFTQQGFSFSAYPTELLNDIKVIKTYSPNYKAEFGSGVIEINTIKIPAKNFTTIAVQGSNIPNTTSKDFLYNRKSESDYLGLDKDDSRSLPNSFPNVQTFVDSVNSELSLVKGTDEIRKLNGDWGIKKRNASPDLNLQLTNGTVFKLGKDAIGLVLSLNYLNANRIANNTTQRIINDTLKRDSIGNDIYSNKVDWAGTINLGYQIGKHSTISFRNQIGINSLDQTKISDGSSFVNKTRTDFVQNYQYQYQTHQSFNSQLDGEHKIGIKNYQFDVNWAVNYNDVYRNEPDTRTINSLKDTIPVFIDDTVLVKPKFKVSPNATRDFRLSYEKVKSGKIDFRLPINFINSRNALSFGAFYEERKVDFRSRNFRYEQNLVDDVNVDSVFALPFDSIFQNQNINYQTLIAKELPFSKAFKPETKITAFHVSLENNITDFIKLNYGFRYEKFEQKFNLLNSKDSLDIKQNILVFAPEDSLKNDTNFVQYGDTSYNRFFPSINIQFKINDRERFRISFSRTINRPNFNELFTQGFYDFNTAFTSFGNQKLTFAILNNYDFRYQLYTANGDNFTIGAFYKKIDNPIELVEFVKPGGPIPFSTSLIWVNAATAKQTGLELSANRNLKFIDKAFGSNFFKNFMAYAAIQISESKVNYSGTLLKTGQNLTNKPMNGQVPLLLNAGLVYDCRPLGLNAGFIFNSYSRRLLYVSNRGGDVFQSAQNLLDLHVAKDIGRLNIRAAVQNVFAQNTYYYRNFVKEFNSDSYQSKDQALQIFRTTPIYSLRLALRLY